jgi:hypothetical protein
MFDNWEDWDNEDSLVPVLDVHKKDELKRLEERKLIEESDKALTNDCYRICIFRPDLLHFGPAVPKNRELGEFRKTLFFSLTPQSVIDDIRAKTKRGADVYEIQHHPITMIRHICKGVKAVNYFSKPITEKSVAAIYQQYLPDELLNVLDK